MAEEDLTMDLKGEAALRTAADALPQRLRGRAIVDGLERSALLLEAHVKEQKLSGQVLNVRSGRLRGSIGHRVDVDEDGATARVGTNVAYARLHEYGGVVRPVRAKWLTIPTEHALTPAGVPRFSARQVIAAPTAYGYEATFFSGRTLYGAKGVRRVPTGKKLTRRKALKGLVLGTKSIREVTQSRSIPLFRLAASATIPARPWLRPALAEKREEIIGIMTNAIADAAAGAA